MMDSGSLDTDMGLGALHFPLDSEGTMGTDGSLLSGLTSVAMMDDGTTPDHTLSDGSMIASAGLEIGDYIPHTGIDPTSTLSSFTNEMLFQNSPLPQVGPALATNDHLYGPSLHRPPTPNCGNFTHQDFNFQNVQAGSQYSSSLSKDSSNLTQMTTFHSTMTGGLGQSSEQLSTFRFPNVSFQPQSPNQVQYTSAVNENHSVQPQFPQMGVQQSNLLNGAPGFRQPVASQINTNVPNTNTFTLRVPLPTTVTKGLKVHLVATGQGTLPLNTGNSDCNGDSQSAQSTTSNVMLFRDKVTGKNFLVPTGPPTITNTVTTTEDPNSSQAAELNSANSTEAVAIAEPLEMPVVKQVFDVNEFLNIPQKEKSTSVEINEKADNDKSSYGVKNYEEQNETMNGSDASSISDAKLVIDEDQSVIQAVQGSSPPVETVTHKYHTRHKSKIVALQAQNNAAENNKETGDETETIVRACDMDLDSAKTGLDLIKMMSLMARKGNNTEPKPTTKTMQVEPVISDLGPSSESHGDVQNFTEEKAQHNTESTNSTDISQTHNEQRSMNFEIQTSTENRFETEDNSEISYVEMQPVVAPDCTGTNVVSTGSDVVTATISNDNQINHATETNVINSEMIGMMQQSQGGAIVQTEKRIANLVPDSMKDFVRDIFEDEDALDKDCIKHIMDDTAAPTAQAQVVVPGDSANLTADGIAKLAVKTLSDADGANAIKQSSTAEVSVHVDESQCVTVDGVKRWTCNVCPKMYSTKHNLVIHILSHCGVKPHACGICGKAFKQTSHLQTHMLSHSNVKPHMCKTCGKSFTQASHLKRHSAIHMETKPHVCDICSRGFAFPSELRQHKEKHANGEENICSDCGQSFDTPKALKHHRNAVHLANKERLQCNECNREFVYPSQLRDHMMKHSGKRPFICGECGMDFMKEHHLKSHMFTHTGLQPHQCSICDKSFNQKANLQRHMLIHEENKYKCEICERTFAQPQVMKSHMQTHSGEKAYQCTECGKRFSRRHNLNGHMALHSGSKKYVCFCGAAFTLKGNLNRHRNTKHGLSDASLLVSDDTAAEAAAQILNEMSAKRVQPPVESGASSGEFETIHAETSEAVIQWPADINIEFSDLIPKKKRKSVPRKTKNKGEEEVNSDRSNATNLEAGDSRAKQLKPNQNISKLSESDDSNLSPAKPSSARRKKKAVAKATSVQAEVEQDDVEQEWRRLADDGTTPDQSQHGDTSQNNMREVRKQLNRVWTDLNNLKNTSGCQDTGSNLVNKNNSEDFVMEVDEQGRPKDDLVTILPL